MHATSDRTLNITETISAAEDLRADVPLDPQSFEWIRRRMLLEFCKWDSQIGDTATLSPFPLLIRRSTWQRLARLSELATAELLAAEKELLHRPELHRDLGLPRTIRRCLSGKNIASPAAARVMRFDFHPTSEGWRVSEVNSDVPGGFTESSSFTSLMAQHFEKMPTGSPVDAWAEALARVGKSAALLYAPGYLEDGQIMAYLSKCLAERGVRAYLAKPEQLGFVDGEAHLECASHCGPVDLVVRFFQSEWLPKTGRRENWEPFFVRSRTPIANPATVILTETKRLPLVFDRLQVPMKIWQSLLPETRDPRNVRWRNDESWLVKTALCNTGDTVCMRERLGPRQWLKIKGEIFLRPDDWIAQKRFDATPIDSPVGEIYPCIGVYTIDGKAAGIYGRYSPKPLIDFAAVDAAILVEEER